MGLYQAGAGVSVSPSGRHPVGIYKQTRGTAQWAVPLFRFSCPGTQEKGTPPPAPPPLRGGGELEAAAPPRKHRVTIAALAGHACRSCGTGPSGRAAAAPPTGSRVGLWQVRPPPKPARRSPKGPRKPAAGAPSVGHSRDRSAARAVQAEALPPRPAPPAWPPLPGSDGPAGGTGRPGTPPLPVRRAAAGRAFPLGRSLRPLPGAPGRSPAHAGALAP